MTSASLQPPRVVNVSDLRELARRRLPRFLFDYIDGGAERELTLARNCAAYEEITFRPRYAVDVRRCELATTLFGSRLELPFLLAPIGSSRAFWPQGEIVAAAAAGGAGAGYVLSTLSGCRLEDVKAATPAPAWYQLYLVGGREVATAAILRARAAGYSALVVTIDTPVAGLRERDFRSGMVALLSPGLLGKLPYLGQFLGRPGWVARWRRDGGLMNFPNIIVDGAPMAYADIASALAASAVRWEDFDWIRAAWNGPIIVKGVHTADDARRAVQAGAAGVVVSNHGGRQLDGVAATINVLPEVVAAVGRECTVMLDGGIRRGSDIAKALCLGAKAVLIGRAYAFALGAAGGAGVSRAISILREELMRTMQLLGCRNVSDLGNDLVRDYGESS